MNRYYCSLIHSDSLVIEHKKEMNNIVIDVYFETEGDTGIYLSYEDAEKLRDQLNDLLMEVKGNE